MSIRRLLVASCCVTWLACDGSGDGTGDEPERRPRDAGADAAENTGDAAAPSCDAVAPLTCPSPTPHFSDVSPIFARRCSSCHNGAGEQWPLNSYDHIADWYGEIRAQMLACTMPPPSAGIDMPLAERQTILSWIRCGFPK